MTIDNTAPAAPTATLTNDTGVDDTDGITSDGSVTVSGLEPDATWEYSIDGGATWTTGTGTEFTLPEGEYPDGEVLVRQTDAAGNTSPEGSLGAVSVVSLDGVDEVATALLNILAAESAADHGEADYGLLGVYLNLIGLDLQANVLGTSTVEFEVDPGHTQDLTFEFDSTLSAAVLGDLRIVIQKWDPATEAWTAIDNSEDEASILEIGLLGGGGDGVTVEGLGSGEYRAFIAADGVVATVASSLSVSGTDYDNTVIVGYEGVAVNGNVLDNDAADTIVESVNSEPVGAGGATIVGTYGTLEIDQDGTYTYTPFDADDSGIGQVDVFEYTLTDTISGASALATLYVQIDSESVEMTWDENDPSLPATFAFSASDDTADASVVWANVVDEDFFTEADGELIGVGDQTYISDTFTITENMEVSGSVEVSVLLAAIASGEVFLEREASPGTWETVASDSFSIVLGGLGTVSTIDLSTVDFTAGDYRVRATKSGLASVTLNIATDVDVVYLDQFEIESAVGAVGNLLDNDVEGSEFSTLQVDNGSGFVDVTDSTVVAGDFGTLTIDADGNYTYTPDGTYFDTTSQDVFDYQLVHPVTGAVAGGSLTVTLEPSGAGVLLAPSVEPFAMAFAEESDGSQESDFAQSHDAGLETLNWQGGDDVIALGDYVGEFSNIQAIDLDEENAVTLSVGLEDLLSISSGDESFYINGDGSDTVDILAEWDAADSGSAHGDDYNIYVSIDDPTQELWVENGINVV